MMFHSRVIDMKHTNCKGQTLVEFTLLLPLMLILIFGIIEFGLFIYNQQVITNACREGARAGILASSPRVPYSGANSIDSVVQAYAANLITFGTANNPVTTVTPAYNPTATFGSDLTVQVRYNYSFLVIPDFLLWGSKLRVMSAQTVMRYE